MQTRLQTALKIEAIAEPYIKRRATRHLEKGRIVIFGAGTGNPYFTTDSAAALRAAEIEADIIIKATKVNGLYTSDPVKDPEAKFLSYCNYDDFISNNLKIMDVTAIDLCRQSNIPIIVLDFFKENILYDLLIKKEKIGSLISKEDVWPI